MLQTKFRGLLQVCISCVRRTPVRRYNGLHWIGPLRHPILQL